MAILGNKNIFDNDIDEREEYTLPAVSREKEDGMSFKKSVIFSTILHPTVLGLIWLIVFVLALANLIYSSTSYLHIEFLIPRYGLCFK